MLAEAKQDHGPTVQYLNADVRVRVCGNVAVVTGVAKPQAEKEGVPAILFTDIWMRRSTRWKVVVTQGTRVSSVTK